jgi:hypothetical protein
MNRYPGKALAVDLWIFRLLYGRVHLGKCMHSCTEQMCTHLYGIGQIMYTQLY